MPIAHNGTYDGFRSVEINDDYDEKIVLIENRGSAALTVSGYSVSGSVFTFSGDSTFTILPNDNDFFTVRFDPSATGSYTETLTISTNDPDTLQFNIELTATAVNSIPILALECSGSGIADNGSYTSLFGTLMLTEDTTKIFTITNNGSADLELTGFPSRIELTGSDSSMFTLIGAEPTSPLAPDESTTFSVQYDPSSEDSHSITVTIPNNSSVSDYSFTAGGTGTPFHGEMEVDTCSRQMVSIDIERGNDIFIAYTDDDTSDLLFTRSLNGGEEWTTVTVDSGVYLQHPRAMEASHTGTDYIYITYPDSDKPYYMRSENWGTSWTIKNKISDLPTLRSSMYWNENGTSPLFVYIAYDAPYYTLYHTDLSLYSYPMSNTTHNCFGMSIVEDSSYNRYSLILDLTDGLQVAKRTSTTLTFSSISGTIDLPNYPDAMVISAQGYVGIAYMYGNALYFFRTTNGGSSWSTPAVLDSEAYTPYDDLVAATEEDGTIYIAYAMRNGNDRYELRLAKSADFGAHWTSGYSGFTGKILISEPGYYVENLSIAADDNSVVIASQVYIDGNPDAPLMLHKSIDGGVTF